MLRYVATNYKNTILPFAVFAVIVAFSYFGISRMAGSSDRSRYDLTIRALRRAADDCYAIEGQYPPNINYLYDNYRVKVDTEKFFVVYEIFAFDIRPSIMLIDRGIPLYE